MHESVINTRSSARLKNRLLICIGTLEPIFPVFNDPTKNNSRLFHKEGIYSQTKTLIVIPLATPHFPLSSSGFDATMGELCLAVTRQPDDVV